MILANRIISSVFLLCAGVAPLAAQQANTDQVGLVVPAFDGELGARVAFVLKTAIQRELASEDPVTGVRGIGRAATYYVPTQMAEPGHEQAARLARANGMQGTLWGVSTPLVDGVAYTAYLTLSEPFEDFRSEKREIWRIQSGEEVLSLEPPQRVVAFRPATFSPDTVERYGSPDGIEYCPIGGGDCVRFTTYAVTRARAVRNDGVVIRRGGKDYLVQMPMAEFLDADPVGYAALYLAYARGNLNLAIQKAGGLIEVAQSVSVKVDAYLFRAAAHARMKNFKGAREDIGAALELAPAAARTLRYAIMIEFASAGKPTEAAGAYAETFFRNYVAQTPFDKSVERLLGQR